MEYTSMRPSRIIWSVYSGARNQRSMSHLLLSAYCCRMTVARGQNWCCLSIVNKLLSHDGGSWIEVRPLVNLLLKLLSLMAYQHFILTFNRVPNISPEFWDIPITFAQWSCAISKNVPTIDLNYLPLSVLLITAVNFPTLFVISNRDCRPLLKSNVLLWPRDLGLISRNELAC